MSAIRSDVFPPGNVEHSRTVVLSMIRHLDVIKRFRNPEKLTVLKINIQKLHM